VTRPSRPDVFARASTRLVILFTAIIVLLVCVSGVVMYLNVKTNIAEVARGGEGGESGSERDLASRSISRLRWQLLALDGALIVTVGALGLWYARRTLRPIRELYGAQKRFVADASHELRTPLAIMKADFEVALRGRGSGAGPPGETGVPRESPRGQGAGATSGETEELRESLRSGLEEVDRMSAIVADLLLLSRIDAHQEELRFAPVDLAELVRDTAEGMRTMAERAGVAVAVTAPDGPVSASVDAAHLERALRNVVRNAIEHSSAGDAVEVSLSAVGATAVIGVADQGVGIAAADVEHVFDRFYRSDTSRSRDRGGSGLGLAIARWIVERHGGAITVASTPGQGTTIAFELPLAAHHG
jgi:two-component system, OmpR family, sensor histidine kinase CiaH